MSWISFHPLLTGLLAIMHPFFVSVIDISHNEKAETIEISIRTFTNDLEKRIAAENNIVLDLSRANEKTKADVAISAYLNKKFALTANGKNCKMDYLGYEIQKESTWTYFEVKNIKQLNQLKIQCEVLFGINPQQINIIHVKAKQETKSFELIYPKNSTQFDF